MPRKAYEWSPGEPPPIIEAHSLAKHEVLRRYLVTYVDVITANPTIERLRLTLVDGFAGGGLYTTRDSRTICEGSPLLMLSAMAEAEAAARAKRVKPFAIEAHYVFIEENRNTRSYLMSTLRERGYRPNEEDSNVLVLLGSFLEHANDIVKDIGRRGRAGAHRCIFLLDQYGYSDVPLHIIKTIFAGLPRAEVILTFATDWLLDYMQDSPDFRERLKRMGLARLHARLPEILNAKASPEWRRLAQSSLYEDLWHGSGARFFTPFFIRSEAAGRDYWLVHLSNHAKARDEMTKLHWTLENRFQHYGRHGFSMLGYKASEDPSVTGQETFLFDTDARVSTHNALLDEIPRSLADGDGMKFETYFERVCNETPASSSILVEVVRELGRAGEVEVLDADGKPRRPGVQVRPTDIIRLPHQTMLDLSPGGRHGRR